MADENGTNGKEKAVELKSIYVEVWPDWKGPRVQREFRCGDGEHKFTTGLPCPQTDEEAQAIYGVNVEYATNKGWLQHSYDKDTNLGNILKAEVKKGTDMNSLPAMVAETIEKDFIWTETERKTGEASQLKAAKAELGMSLSEMIALAKKVKAGEITA